jgi:phage shock protein C
LAYNERAVNGTSLTRSKSDKMIFGVCGGIARRFGWDPTLVRVVYVILSLCSAAFPGILFYILLAILMPPEN